MELGSIPGFSEEFEKNQNSCRNFGDNFKKICNRTMDFCTPYKLPHLKKDKFSLFFSALCSLFLSTEYFIQQSFELKFKSKKLPTNTPPKNRPYTLIESKMGFHLALPLFSQDAICVLYFSSKSCRFLTVGSPPLLREPRQGRSLLPALRGLTTRWQ